MINDFINIGGEQGDCITFPERNSGSRSSNAAWIGPDQIDITNQYLSALALEYKLLTRNNQNTDETIKEIFYLIKTINRLDAFADEFWNSSPPTNEDFSSVSQTTNLNGFMLREDMPSYYLNNHLTHFNYELLEAGYNGSPSSVVNPVNSYKSFTGLEHINDFVNDNKFQDYSGFGKKSGSRKKMVWPHDKYYSMFAAFMLLKKYLPAGTTYSENGMVQTFQDGETDIRTEVVNITNRCHLYLRGNRFPPHISNWVMLYPDGSHDDSELGICQPFSYPITRTICHINNNYPWSVAGCISYSDFFAESSYNAFGALCGTSGVSDDVAVFLSDNQATSNVPVNTTGIGVLTPMFIAMNLTASVKSVEWSELLRYVLHQTGFVLKGKSVYADPINKAPCTGPYYFDTSDRPDWEWRSQDRLEHPKSRNGTAPPGNYPGVDYMLLHNLYYEYLNQLDDKPSGSEAAAYKYAYNFMDNEDNSIWPKKIVFPFATIYLGVNLTDATHRLGNVKVFQNLKSTAQIYATASPLAHLNTTPSSVTYRAGKEIALLPGFEVEAGSTFDAYIKRYICGDDDYIAGMRSAKDSTNQSSNDYEGDDMNDVPLHYVAYPKSDADNYPFGDEELNVNESINPALDNQIKITPNPSTGIFKVESKTISDTEKLSIQVYDMLGNLILELKDVSDNIEIDLQKHSKGVYVVHVISNFGITKTLKVSIIE